MHETYTLRVHQQWFRKMQRFIDKNVLITGAASGIGRATALRIAEEGGSLALIDIEEGGLAELVSQLRSQGYRVTFACCDISDKEKLNSCVSELAQTLGGIQAISHNAGILRCYHTHLMSATEWDEIIRVNLNGTFNIVSATVPWLLKQPQSYVVFTSSCAADIPHPWMSAYAASKGAIRSFARSLAIEYYLQGIRVNCVMPGSISTPLGNAFSIPTGADTCLLSTLSPLSREKVIDPKHAAGAIAFLTSEDAYHITGTELTVNGGGF